MLDNTVTTNLTYSNTDTTIISIGQEKSLFERAIIEAFKQKQSTSIYERLAIAMDEIKFIVNDIKSLANPAESNMCKKRCLLNKNILDKLSRIIERRFFNVNILIAKIFENLLDPNNFEILSSEIDLLVNLANEVLNLLEEIKSTIVSRQLEKKCNSFLNYLSNLPGINEEQKLIISELIQGFPTRNSSLTYKTFDDTKEKILKLCKNPNVDDKLEGINLLMDNFGNTVSLEEQFDLLLEKVPAIVKAVIHQPNPEFKDAYFQLGNFICSMLFATKFKVDAFLPDYRINRKDINKNYFFFFADDELVDEFSKDETSFLHNSVYELTTQKEMLTRCENVFQICNLIVNTLSVYDSIFDLQFVCYIILKRIYFTFPQFKKNISDTLAMVLVNLCSFKENFEIENSEECKQFIHFILKNGDDDLKHKIIKRIETRGVNIQLKDEFTELVNVEYEQLKLSDFNLRIGYPCSYEVEAGGEMSKYIEVHNANSLIYIGFATQSNDITLHLLKYIPNDQPHGSTTTINDELDSVEDVDKEGSEEYTDKGHFKTLLKLDRIDSSLTPVKIVFFVSEPGTYKLIFDNTFSWFTSKIMRHRFSVLTPISEIEIERKVDFDKLRREMRAALTQPNSKNILADKCVKTNTNPHMNKILMVKFEGHNRTYNLGNIFHDEKFLKENTINYIPIPVILTKNSIRIVRTITDEHGVNKEDIKEISIENGLESENKPYHAIFEDEMINYFNSMKDFSEKTIFLNTFILEKQLSIIQSESSTLPVSNDEFYKSVFGKLGFYPETLLEKFPNVRMFCSSLADSCLLYILYDKILKEEKFINIIHVHFDKYKAQTSLYFEGVIHDKISGFNYNDDKTLIENVDNVLEFINKVSVIFGAFDLSVSYSEIDDKLFELFTDELRNKLSSIETKINLETKDPKFLNDAINSIQLFHMTG